MTIHLRSDDVNKGHARFTVFINGKNTGTLCMTPDEGCALLTIVNNGCLPGTDAFMFSGHWLLKEDRE